MKRIADYFNFLLFERGETVQIDLISATALLSSAPGSGYYTDDKNLRTPAQLHSGSLVQYQGSEWLVVSQVQEHSNHYEGRIRKSNHWTKFIIDDWLYTFPSILEMVNLTIDENKSINVVTGNIKVTLPANGSTQSITVNTRFIASLAAWKVIGIDLTETGLVILTASRDVFVAGDDQEQEIANANALPVWAVIVDPAHLTLQPEDTAPLTATLMRNDTEQTDADFVWHTAVPAVATVSAGQVMALAEGATQITACWDKHLTVQATAEITVVAAPVQVITYAFYSVYADGRDKSYTNFNILENDTRVFGVEKRINGVVTTENDNYTFTFHPNGATAANYVYTVLNSYSVQIQNKRLYSAGQVTLTAVSNVTSESISISFRLKSMF